MRIEIQSSHTKRRSRKKPGASRARLGRSTKLFVLPCFPNLQKNLPLWPFVEKKEKKEREKKKKKKEK